ncbi:MAG: hypothetical protein NZ518_00710, partial [Dehalococcoidia bacterium]|nr:hypothetical protein [Dehalococcoidia bacterium]
MASRILLAFQLAVRVAPILPRPWLVAFALPLADAIARSETAPIRQHRVNIARAIARPVDDPVTREVAGRAVRVQTLNYLDFFRNAQLPFAQQWRVASFTGEDILRAALALGRGAVIVGAHLGSVDRLGHLLPVYGFPSAAFVERLRPPDFHDFVTRIRERSGGVAIPIGPDAPRRAAAALREGRVVG